jgi:hypothetical protein
MTDAANRPRLSVSGTAHLLPCVLARIRGALMGSSWVLFVAPGRRTAQTRPQGGGPPSWWASQEGGQRDGEQSGAPRASDDGGPAAWRYSPLVLVQGRAARYRTWSAPDSIVTRLALVEPGRADSTMSLSLQWGSPDPLLASWRRLPVVGRLVPPPQRPQWGTLAVYRIQLQGRPSGVPGGADAVLLDKE